MITDLLKKIMTPVRLIEVIEEVPETYTFKFETPENISWTPGTHAHFLIADLQKGQALNRQLVREFSIMSHPGEGYLGVTTRIRSNPSLCKQAMKALNPGDQIQIFKIRNHIQPQKTDNPVILISMGVGIATFRPIILDYIKSNTQIPITNINIDRSGKFVYWDELSNIPETKLENVFVTSRNDLYKSIDEALKNRENIYYVIGSKDFSKDIGNYLVKNSVPKRLIKFDKR